MTLGHVWAEVCRATLSVVCAAFCVDKLCGAKYAIELDLGHPACGLLILSLAAFPRNETASLKQIASLHRQIPHGACTTIRCPRLI